MDNKTLIIENALNLFSSRGYDAVGVQEIAVKSNVTKPTLYHYFKNKVGLLDTILNKYFTDLNNQLKITAQYNHDITKSLNDITKGYFYFALNNQIFFRLQLSLYFTAIENEANKAVRKYTETQYKIIEELFIKAAGDHGNMKGRHKEFAVTFIGMIHSYIGLLINKYINLDDTIIYKAVHQFMHGIFS
jgi:TetR/AcrR family transcriptional regulator